MILWACAHCLGICPPLLRMSLSVILIENATHSQGVGVEDRTLGGTPGGLGGDLPPDERKKVLTIFWT
jgi:hypothetical protein